LLGALAGVSITFISMAPALNMYMTPVIGIVCFAIILASWFGGVKYGKIPAGLVAIAAGMLIAWGSTAIAGTSFGQAHHFEAFGGMSVGKLKDSLSTFSVSLPHPQVGL